MVYKVTWKCNNTVNMNLTFSGYDNQHSKLNKSLF